MTKQECLTRADKMQITVQIRTVYGNEQIYPVCDKAKAFAAIAGTRTLTLQTIKQIRALGYSIEVSAASDLAAALNA